MKISKELLLKIFLTVCLFSPLTNCGYAESEIVRCSQQHFECYKGRTETQQKIKQIAKKAADVVGPPSLGIPKKVYLTKFSLSDNDPSGGADSEPAFYAQTNFKPQKSHSNKFFITDGFSRILGEIKKITGESETDPGNIEYYIEPELLDDERFQEFFDDPERFGNKSHLFVVDAGNEHPSLKLIRQNGQIDWAKNTGKIKNWFESLKNSDSFYVLQKDDQENEQFKPYLKIAAHLYIQREALEEFNRNADLPINSDNIRVLNFFTDTDSREVIKKSFPNKRVEFNLEEVKNRTEDQNLVFLKNNFKLHRNKMIFVIGHINEKGDYEIENAVSKGIFSISTEGLENIAAHHDINIIHLGCKSALHSASGTINTVYSTDVTKQLFIAVNAKTQKEFIINLTSENLVLRIDRIFVEETRVKFEAAVHKKGNDGNHGNKGNGGNGGNNGNGGNGNKGGKYEYDEVGEINISFPRIKPFVLPSPSPTPDDKSTLPLELSGVFLYLVIGLSGGGFFIFFVLLCKVLHKKFQESAPSEEMIEVPCPFCGKKNRVIEKSATSAICGNRKCKKPLFK